MQLSKHPSRHSFTSGSPLQGQPCREVRRCRTAPLLPITATVATPTRLPDQQQAQQASEPAPSVRALNKLIGGLAFWQAQQKAKADDGTDDNVMEDAVLRGREASGQHGLQPRPADIGQYLHPTGILETRYTRLMASLCSHTYYMEKLTQKMLWRKHRLNLVTTSRDIGTYEALLSRKSVKQAAAEGDGMAVSPRIVETSTAIMDDVAPSSAALKTLNAALEAPPASSAARSPPTGHRQPSPTEIVAQKLQAAAAAAAAAAAPLASGVSSFTGAFSGAVGAVPLGAVSSQLQSAALAGHSTAVATIATVTAAVNSTWRKDHPSKASKGKAQADPTQWFVCDDPMSFTRYFVLQGSETLDHWRVNLTFDPVPFEDPELGVKVHRGVYEAAEILYQRFLPLVVEHLASRPFAKIAFTGHSLGGSLGTLLQLMFLRRGEIPAVAISPTYTFGAPAVFCEGGACKVAASAEAQSAAEAPAPQEDASTGGSGSAAQAEDVPAAPQAAAGSACGLSNPGHSLLQRLGLPEGAFRNIVMNRDIVPRAFACDYTLVADLLRRVGGGFKEHPCLSGPDRVVMYFFVGKMLVLQPDMEHNFVRPGEEYHPMLPTGPGLYTLRTPTALDAMAANAKKEVNNIVAAGASRVISASRAAQAARKEAEQLAANLHAIPSGELAQSLPQLSRSLERVSIAVDAAVAPRTKLKAQAKLGKPSPTLRDAVMDLMNYPHPLTTLGDVSAYGNDGAISRYHDPDHYTQALGGVLRHKTRPWRALMRQDEPDSTEQGARWYVGLQQQQRGMAQRAARRGMTQQQYQARMLQRVNSCGSYMGVEQRPASVLSMSSEWESLRQQGA